MIPVVASREHVLDACRWLSLRGGIGHPRWFPSWGLAIPGVAGCWVYLNDSPVGFLDPLVANPEVDRGIRNKALDILVESVLCECAILGLEVLQATTKLPPVLDRASRHGFRVVESCVTLIAKDLR